VCELALLAAEQKFWWSCHGTSKLRLCVDGAMLATATIFYQRLILDRILEWTRKAITRFCACMERSGGRGGATSRAKKTFAGMVN